MTFDARLDLSLDAFVELQRGEYAERQAATRPARRRPRGKATKSYLSAVATHPAVPVPVARKPTAQERKAARAKLRRQRRNQKRNAKRCSSVPGIELLALDPCSYCDDPHPATHDHVVPFSRGGAHDVTNLTRACWRCNKEKATRSLLVFLVRRAQRIHLTPDT